jgi:hypothetical protein
MRDSAKVIIGFGSIWGLYVFGAMLFSSFTWGANDTVPGLVELVLCGLTILPACILAIWFRKAPAWWLIALSGISVFGFLYQELHQRDHSLADFTFSLAFALIPGLIGKLLLWSRGDELARPLSRETREDRRA